MAQPATSLWLRTLKMPPGAAEAAHRSCPQIEFYFSDSNLPRDAFLLSAVEEAPDGYVSLALICTFKRMRDVLGLEGGDTMLTATQASMAMSRRFDAQVRMILHC